jgi:hypothetical protein
MCRKLKADEIECRIQAVKPNGASLLLYKTARVDRAILTEMYGNLWQNDFKVIDGKMYGGIGIYDKELNQWLWRWDCGTESNTEAEKGQASDCFKRAGFKWGIGIELYSAPFIWINGDGEQLKKTKFHVSEIDYSENGDISKLTIVDDKESVVFKIGKKITSAQKPTPKAESVEDYNKKIDEQLGIEQSKLTCSDCGAEITEKVANYSHSAYGKALCFKCQKLNKKLA